MQRAVVVCLSGCGNPIASAGTKLRIVAHAGNLTAFAGRIRTCIGKLGSFLCKNRADNRDNAFLFHLVLLVQSGNRRLCLLFCYGVKDCIAFAANLLCPDNCLDNFCI